MKLALGCDFVGLTLKKAVIDYLEANQIEYEDFGAFDAENSDYPIYALKAANAVRDGVCDMGLLFCGTGAMMSPTSSNQGESIPGICHLVCLEGCV